MNEPDWAKVLNYLYQYERRLECGLSDNRGNNAILEESLEGHSILSETGLSPSDAIEAIEFLVSQDLCKKVTRGDASPALSSTTNYRRATIIITPDGFDVAHEREITKSQQKTNRKSTRLSAYLVIGIVLQSLVAILQYNENWQTVTVSVIILLLVALVLAEIFRESIDERFEKYRLLDRIPFL